MVLIHLYSYLFEPMTYNVLKLNGLALYLALGNIEPMTYNVLKRI